MIISVINHTDGEESDQRVQAVLRAVNRQVEEDFRPYWSLAGECRLEGEIGANPNAQAAKELRGDAIIYLWNEVDVAGALGYHSRNFAGIPFGFVFTELSQALGEDWSVTLSHEVLELLADPHVNLLVQGPHPSQERLVYHWYEMCDAVQTEQYEIDGVKVSNFVLPAYFTGEEESGGRNDFLGSDLQSFGINPGGYVGFFDPLSGGHDTHTGGNKTAKKRHKTKEKLGQTRRSERHQRYVTAEQSKAGGRALGYAKEGAAAKR